MNHPSRPDWDRIEGIAAMTGILVAIIVSVLVVWLPLAVYIGFRLAEWVVS